MSIFVYLKPCAVSVYANNGTYGKGIISLTLEELQN